MQAISAMAQVKEFFEGKNGKVMFLHMGRMGTKFSDVIERDRKQASVCACGVIQEVIYHDGTGQYKEGFQVQLGTRDGLHYSSPENFFSGFDGTTEFPCKTKVIRDSFCDWMYIVYPDESFFLIEVRI